MEELKRSRREKEIIDTLILFLIRYASIPTSHNTLAA